MNFKLIQEDRKCFADKNESGTQVFGVYTGGQVADGLGRVVYPVSQLDRWGWAFAPG